MATEFTRQEFLDAYFGYLATKDDSLFWAVELFFSDWDQCDEKLDLVLALVDASPDAASLSRVAAGPLEDLFLNCGDAVIDRIGTEAHGKPNLGRALVGVWGLERFPAIGARVNRILEQQHLPPVRHLSDEALRRIDQEVRRGMARSLRNEADGSSETPSSGDLPGH